MTANTDPIFTLVPKIGHGIISTANTNLDGSGTIVTIITGGTNGTRITRIVTQAITTTTAGIVRLYIYDGAEYMLWREISVTAITIDNSTVGFTSTIDLNGEKALILPYGWSLAAAPSIAESFVVTAEGGDY